MSMRKLLDFVQGGATKLPPGFRFQPTEEEIIYDYLFKKTFSYPLPASVVPEIFIYKFDPWDMPGDEEQDKYFFTKIETKYQKGNRVNQATKSGYWKSTGSNKKIKCLKKSRDTNNVMGMRKAMVFHMGKSPNGYKTEWIMHEYRLIDLSETKTTCNVQNNSSSQNRVQLGEWLLCHVFLKKQSTMIDHDDKNEKDYDLLNSNDLGMSNSSSSSCGSSSITEVTSVRKHRNSYFTTNS